jgi:hypothetical protein
MISKLMTLTTLEHAVWQHLVHHGAHPTRLVVRPSEGEEMVQELHRSGLPEWQHTSMDALQGGWLCLAHRKGGAG